MEEDRSFIEIAIHEDAWLEDMTEEKWLDLFKRCYALILSEKITDDVSICLTNDEEMTALNTQYRQKPYPTNVLSFPQETNGILGDIVLSYDVIQKEAAEQSKSFMDHVTHLFVHGLLHLNGHDHETPEESQEMESLEIKALKILGIGNPYV